MKKYEKERLLKALGLEFVSTEEQKEKFFNEIDEFLKKQKRKSFYKGAGMEKRKICS